jgi:hypothetical protein
MNETLNSRRLIGGSSRHQSKFSQIHSFVYSHSQEAAAPTLLSGESVCRRIAFFFYLGMIVSLVL